MLTDVALDPYTATAMTGWSTTSGYVLNDETVEVLVGQALDPGARPAPTSSRRRT